jgi:hypothetical protein
MLRKITKFYFKNYNKHMEKKQNFFMLKQVVLTASMLCFSPPNSAICKTSETGNI